MTDEYTPPLADFRTFWIDAKNERRKDNFTDAERGAEFDRRIAAVKAEALEEAAQLVELAQMLIPGIRYRDFAELAETEDRWATARATLSPSNDTKDDSHE